LFNKSLRKSLKVALPSSG